MLLDMALALAASDVSALLREPFTVEEIAAKRRDADFFNTPAGKTLMWTPIPFVDMLAAAAVAAADASVNGDREKPWRDVNGAINADWSDSIVARRYVDKVRAQNRELIFQEVENLSKALAAERQAKAMASNAAGILGEAASEAVSGVFGNWGDLFSAKTGQRSSDAKQPPEPEVRKDSK